MVKTKKIKTRIKGWLIVKIAQLRKENKKLKTKVEEFVLKEQDYIDELNRLRSEIRGLKLENERLEKDARNNIKEK